MKHNTLAVIAVTLGSAWTLPAISQSTSPHCEPTAPGEAPPVLFKVTLSQSTSVGINGVGTTVEAEGLLSSGVVERTSDEDYSTDGTGHLHAYSSLRAHGGKLSGQLVTESSHNVPGAGALASVTSQTGVNVFVRVDSTVDWRLSITAEGAMAESSTDSRHATVSYYGWGPSIVDDFSYHSAGSVTESTERTGTSGPNGWDVLTFPEYPGVKYNKIATLVQTLGSRFGSGYCAFDCPAPSHAETSIDISFSIDVVVGDCPRASSADLLDYLYLRNVDWADTFRLAYSSVTVGGFAADGVTPIVIRTPRFACPGSVHITVFDEFQSTSPTDVGALKDSPDGPAANPLVVPLRNIPVADEWIGFAYLRAPADFVRQTHYAEDAKRGRNNPRRLTVCMQYCPTNGTCMDLPETTIELHRPPIVLVHGLWSSPYAWQWPLEDDHRFVVTRADYSATNASSFATNVAAVRDSIFFATLSVQQERIAATQADVVGHSMGGILARMYASNYGGLLRRPDNYFSGDVHKLITLDSPLLGSQLANLLASHPKTATRVGCAWERATGLQVDEGAVYDLRTDSPAIAELGTIYLATGIPVSKLTGIGGSLYWYDPYTLLVSGFLDLFCGITDLQTEVFHDLHDALVSLQSQRSGASVASQLIPLPRILHAGSRGVNVSVEASDLAVELLNQSVESIQFARGFVPAAGEPPPTACNYRGSDWCEGSTNPTAVLARDDDSSGSPPGSSDLLVVELVDPGGLVDVPSGSNILVKVMVPSALDGPECFVVTSFQESAVAEGPEYLVSIGLPLEFAGPFAVSAFCSDEARTIIANKIELVATPTAHLLGLHPQPDSVLLTRFANHRRLSILGDFDDGVRRELTQTQSLSLTTTNGNVAVVDVSGLVSATGLGTGSVIASIQGHETTIPVQVLSIKFDANDNGTIDTTDAAHILACLQGPRGTGELQPLACVDLFDADHDLDVDLDDYAALHNALENTGL